MAFHVLNVLDASSPLYHLFTDGTKHQQQYTSVQAEAHCDQHATSDQGLWHGLDVGTKESHAGGSVYDTP